MKSILLLFSICFVFFVKAQSNYPLIPLPNKCTIQNGEFILTDKTQIFNSQGINRLSDYLQDQLQITAGPAILNLNTEKKSNGIFLNLIKLPNQSSEAYELIISQNEIKINGDTSGIFYGIQTLLQLINEQTYKQIKLPCLIIQDEPRFAWRGMHLDVSRHFFPVTFIKRYIDLLAMYKMNTFHWHLTDDQGWRIEIKKYPQLTQIGGFRKGSMIGAYSDSKFDTINYGGFYTQDEIKEVVKYALDRQITIVPEIEMPGHAQAAIATYPWLSCTQKNVEVAKAWGVFEDVFCTKDSTFNFLTDVLDEVMNLFPGKYIHIGGDECPKTRWKVCTKCQALIKREQLKDEHELQSYFIKRIEKHVNAHGKQIIGWDEILEGGLAPNAAVMSWRGEEGGIAAAKQKHKVVMSPGSHCYFDHYQAPPADEPWAIGGYTPLEKVYAYNPIPKDLNKEEQQYIMGAQANVWTEYILNEKHVEYMALPRMAALGEVLWTNLENKNETNFLNRLQKHFLLLDKMQVNYAKALFQINYQLKNDGKTKGIHLDLSANSSLGQILYTTDGKEPSIKSIVYKDPIQLQGNIIVKSALFQNNQLKGKVTTRFYEINKATNKPIVFKVQPSKYYNKGGAFVLVNSESATLPRINEQWLGWSGDDVDFVLDLDSLQEIKSIDVGFLKEELNWIYLPKTVAISFSTDKINYSETNTITESEIKDERHAIFNFEKTKTRYIKVQAKNHGKIDSGKPGAGEDAWLFCDEIKVY